MKVTVDTNTLISATFWHGDSEKIIIKAEDKKIELILSRDIINEYSDVLGYDEIKDKIKNKKLEMRYSVGKITSISKIVEPLEKLDVVKEDPDDNKVLECAKEGKVDYIITQDNHLLKLKSFEGIEILNPCEFLKKVSK